MDILHTKQGYSWAKQPVAKSSFKLQAAVDAFRGVPQGPAAGA